MGGYRYGNKVLTPQYFYFNSWLYYSDASTTSTTYTVYFTAGAQLSSNTGAVQKTMTCTLTDLSGVHTTRTATKKFSTSDMDSNKRSTYLSTQAWTWNKGHNQSTKQVRVRLSGIGGDGDSIATFDVVVPPLTSYSVSYALNGGSAGGQDFSPQTKYYGETLHLRTATPSKAGYIFSGWKSTAGYIYQPGNSFTGNNSTTLTAQWTAKTCKVNYYKNHSTAQGTIASQTKTWNKSLTLSNGSGFTRTNYKLSHWTTSSTGGTVYQLGGTLSTLSESTYDSGNFNLYAQWVQDYKKPTISYPKAFRVDSSGDPDDFGTRLKVTFEFTNGEQGGVPVTDDLEYTVTIDDVDKGSGTLSSSPFADIYSSDTGYSTDTSHRVVIKICNPDYDTTGTSYTLTIGAYRYPIDLLADGSNVYMGIMTPATSGVTLKTSSIKSTGDIYTNNHSGPIGYRMYNSGTKTGFSSNNSSTAISGDIPISAGTWLFIGAVEYPANSTGVRHLMWYNGSTAISGSRVTINATSGGFTTRVQTITTVYTSTDTNMTLYGFQNSGTAMSVPYYWQAVRIS